MIGLRALLRRHDRRTWLLWAAGATALLAMPVALADPALLLLLLDPELLAVTLMSASALARARAWRLVGRRATVSQDSQERARSRTDF